MVETALTALAHVQAICGRSVSARVQAVGKSGIGKSGVSWLLGCLNASQRGVRSARSYASR